MLKRSIDSNGVIGVRGKRHEQRATPTDLYEQAMKRTTRPGRK